MIKYKLTRMDMTTYNKFTWEIGKTYTIDLPGNELCTNQVFHFYDSPELAILLNPIHANYSSPRLFEAEVDQVAHDGLKGGSKSMTLVRELPVPIVTNTNRVAFGLLCAAEVCRDTSFLNWTKQWLSGVDRHKNLAYTLAMGRPATKAAMAAKFLLNMDKSGNADLQMMMTYYALTTAELVARQAPEATNGKSYPDFKQLALYALCVN